MPLYTFSYYQARKDGLPSTLGECILGDQLDF